MGTMANRHVFAMTDVTSPLATRPGHCVASESATSGHVPTQDGEGRKDMMGSLTLAIDVAPGPTTLLESSDQPGSA
jgi:hypothetical protein